MTEQTNVPLTEPAGDSPVTVPANVAAPQVKPRTKGFDFLLHERVQKMRRAGIWTDLGDRFGALEVRLRPFYDGAVIVKREAAEEAIRMKLGLSDGESIPGEKSIEVNKAAVTMAITGARGTIRCASAMLAIARRHGWRVDGEYVTLAGDEDPEAVREIFAPMLDESMQLLLTLTRASRGLQSLRDEEVDRVGEAFVYGRHVAVDWAD